MADNRGYVYARLRRELGLTPAQAAGAVGGLGGESGKTLSPTARNPHSGAYGIGQWLAGRLTALQSRGNPESLRTQVDHLIAELKGPERGALSALRRTRSVQDATRVWVQGFERPSPGEIRSSMPARLAYSREAFDRFAGGAGGAGSLSGASGRSGGGRSTSTRTITETTPGVDNSAARASLIQQFLSDRGADPLEFAVQANALRDVAPTSTTRTIRSSTALPGGGGARSSGGGDLARMAAQRASVIDAQRLPYQWGGGHGGKTPLHAAVPLDCSGAVSKVLGIDPRVSGQFTKWGRPGDGGNRGVTIAANAGHVLMKINGHWFGTSRTNPGGGAGWIPQAAISPQYLKGFTLRHSNR